ncbi:MAG: TetR/AcrR family transcriptional regulator [Methylobacter sp.]|uniref:TetR/AcrR family transcriptional regulator n=1 Tax=Methylobacter sp. TaxID=2051955 RepID=UPI00272F0BE4|nr:TetR/AcrR family transcriptional regulator [Methylobacter sp.]MDP1666676.1 TetR/AcrR family transcriptional regulator [Methylobacter sp.]
MSLNLQEKILQAASELFYSQGIRATGVDAIVKAASTTKMSLYKYFSSKDDLVIAFLRKRDEDFRVWFVDQVNGKADTPKAKLLAIFDVIGEWMAVPEFRGCAFINAAAEFPLEGNPVHQVSAEFYDHFRNYIADLAEQYGSKSPKNLALQLSLLIEGAIVSEQMKRHSGSAEQAKQAALVLIEGSLSDMPDTSLLTDNSEEEQ